VLKNPETLGSRVRFIFWGLLIIGSIFIIYGFREVIDSQFNISEENSPIIEFHYPLPIVGYSQSTGIETTLRTHEMFAVTNTINGTVDVNAIDPQNINQTFVAIQEHATSGDLRTSNQTLLNIAIPFLQLYHQGSYDKLKTINNQPVYESNFTFEAGNEAPVDALVYLQTKNGIWEYLGAQDFPTIEPYNVLIDSKNSRVTEGLTWVIVGAIPVGLMSEIWIHSRIGRHFYELEKADRESKSNIDPKEYID
jgi:hypothetical protein